MTDEPTRLRVVVRRRRLYVDVDDYAATLRARAAAYRHRADQLLAGELTGVPVLADGDRIVPPLEEALACRMVAEELEQRADQLEDL